MKNVIFSVLIIFMLIAQSDSVFALDDNKAESAKRAWASFECSIFSSYAERKEDSEAHFKVGYEEITKFLNAVEANEITEEEFRNTVPSWDIFFIRGS